MQYFEGHVPDFNQVLLSPLSQLKNDTFFDI